PEQTYGAMIVELPRNGAVIVDLGPKRIPLTDADAKEVRSWRADKTRKPVELGHLLPVRLTADGAAVLLAQRPPRQGARGGVGRWWAATTGGRAGSTARRRPSARSARRSSHSSTPPPSRPGAPPSTA